MRPLGFYRWKVKHEGNLISLLGLCLISLLDFMVRLVINRIRGESRDSALGSWSRHLTRYIQLKFSISLTLGFINLFRAFKICMSWTSRVFFILFIFCSILFCIIRSVQEWTCWKYHADTLRALYWIRPLQRGLTQRGKTRFLQREKNLLMQTACRSG